MTLHREGEWWLKDPPQPEPAALVTEREPVTKPESIARVVWAIFQLVGFIGLLASPDGDHATWDIVTKVGFGVALPALCIYSLLRWRRRREDRSGAGAADPEGGAGVG